MLAAMPKVMLLMAGEADTPTLDHAVRTLSDFGVDCRVEQVADDRRLDLPELAADWEAQGARVFIVAAGAATDLPAAVADSTLLPVLAVPVESGELSGVDLLLAAMKMPEGEDYLTLAVGRAGAVNAALYAVAILSESDRALRERLKAFRAAQAEKVVAESLPQVAPGPNAVIE